MKTKSGEEITLKEFFKRWGEGIKNITPQQKIQNDFNSTIVTLIGFILGLIALIVYRESFGVTLFAYALMLIFIGNIWSTGIKAISLNQQLKFFKDINCNSVDINNLLDSMDKEELKGGEINC